MDLIEELKHKLNNLPNVRFESDQFSLTVFPADANGFEVGVIKNSDDFTVSFNGWHENFDNMEEAATIFGIGLSDECRLREYRRGTFTYKWTMETLEEGKWEEQSTTALLIFPFWRRAEMRYLQNRFLSQQQS